MEVTIEALAVARWQFAITTVYHFFFVPLTLAECLGMYRCQPVQAIVRRRLPRAETREPDLGSHRGNPLSGPRKDLTRFWPLGILVIDY